MSLAILEQKLFEDYQIDSALKLIVKEKRGIKKDLINKLAKALSMDIKDAERMFLVLELLGYISNGISKEGEETWRATKRAYKEVLPVWRLILMDLLGI